MKKYEVMQDFKGSPDGHTVIQFTKGSEIDHAELGDDLASVALSQKWVKPSKAAEKEAKAKAKAEAEAQRQETITAIQSEITTLEQQFAAAADAGQDCAEITMQIEAKQAE